MEVIMNPLNQLLQFVFYSIVLLVSLVLILLFVELCKHGFGGVAMLFLLAFIKGLIDYWEER